MKTRKSDGQPGAGGRFVELNDDVPGWQGMTEQEIQQRLIKRLYG